MRNFQESKNQRSKEKTFSNAVTGQKRNAVLGRNMGMAWNDYRQDTC